MKLTDTAVRALATPPTGFKIYLDDAISGFGVRITKAGIKAFVLTYGANRERVTIGRYPLISLSDARTEAKRILAERTLGKTRPARISLSGALQTYYDKQVSQLRPGTQREIKRLFGRFFPSKGNLDDLTTKALTKLIDDIASPSEAEHFHRAAKTFFKWCVERALLPQSPIANLRAPSRWKSRERVLTDDELRAVWRATADGGTFSQIVRLLIVTGQRRNEIGSMRVEWLDLEKRQCTIPAAFVKNYRSHTYPIGDVSAELLSPLLSQSGSYVFSARGSNGDKPFNGWSKAKAALDKKVAEHLGASTKLIPWTLHDLRRTYCTNLQRLGIKLEVIEALVNHVSGTRAGIVGVYQRHKYENEMREAVQIFEEWFIKNITVA